MVSSKGGCKDSTRSKYPYQSSDTVCRSIIKIGEENEILRMGTLNTGNRKEGAMTKPAICFTRCLVVTFSDGQKESYVSFLSARNDKERMVARAVKENKGWSAGKIIGQIPAGPYTILLGEMEHTLQLLRSKDLEPKYYSWARSI